MHVCVCVCVCVFTFGGFEYGLDEDGVFGYPMGDEQHAFWDALPPTHEIHTAFLQE